MEEGLRRFWCSCDFGCVNRKGVCSIIKGMNSTVELRVDGMTCAGCVHGVTRKLSGVGGVSSAAVDLATGKATVQYDGARAKVEDLVKAVQQIGYQASPL
jgi:Cu+-exporting ATPase